MGFCPDCEDEYSSLGKHLAHPHVSCEYVEPSEEKQELIKGLLLGDGHINNRKNNSRFELNMTNKEFVEDVADRLGWLVSNTSHEERKDFKDVYRLQTISHPYFTRLREQFYKDGERIIPETLEITPTILKMWYVSDGSMTEKARPRITNWGQVQQMDRIVSILSDVGEVSVTPNGDGYDYCIEQDKFFQYIGDTAEGFNRKWP